MQKIPPFRHPDRPPRRLRPLTALRHFRRLIADKEATAEAFAIFNALPSRKYFRTAREFTQSEAGQALYAAEPHLPDLLDDHARLRAMPANSLAQHYCDFMESEGLTAAGLVAEYERNQPVRYPDLFEWYIGRSRDVHDLLHILTGYGRDPLGEACLLAFTYGQRPAPAYLFIAYLAGWEIKRRLKLDAPVFAALNEAKTMGKYCAPLVNQPIADLLAQSPEALRQRLGLSEPVQYHACHAALRSQGHDPYRLLPRDADMAGAAT